jgi:hypothetical protein
MSLLDYPIGRIVPGVMWPELADGVWQHQFYKCAVCYAQVCGYRWSIDGACEQDPNSSVRGDHLHYQCGGVYKELPDMPGFWGGKCGNRSLLKQQLLPIHGSIQDEGGPDF